MGNVWRLLAMHGLRKERRHEGRAFYHTCNQACQKGNTAQQCWEVVTAW